MSGDHRTTVVSELSFGSVVLFCEFQLTSGLWDCVSQDPTAALGLGYFPRTGRAGFYCSTGATKRERERQREREREISQ